MLGVSNEKIKIIKIFHFFVTMATKVVGVARYEKTYFFSIFELLQPFSQRTLRHIQLIVSSKWYKLFIKRKIMRRFYHLLGVTMETIRVQSEYCRKIEIK